MVSIRAAMDDKLLKVQINTPAIEAVRRMTDMKVGHVLIVDKSGVPLGMINERDFLKRCVIAELPLDTPIEKIMSSPLIGIDIDASLGDAMKMMVDNDIRGVFVTEHGKIIGRLTDLGLLGKTLDMFMSLLSLK
jgi:CBS domain-containing protein